MSDELRRLSPAEQPLRRGGRRPIRFPRLDVLKDDAARYSDRWDQERFRKHAEREIPTEPPTGERPPFRPSRLRKYRELLLRKAEALLERREIVIITNGEPLRARLHLFADGTGVFEYEYESSFNSSAGAGRVEPGQRSAEHLARCLEHALLNSRVRPVAHQDI